MINWKLRFKNKTTLVAIIGCVVAFVYQLCGLIGITPAISEDSITNVLGLLINLLVAIGVVVDPTTSGVTDSISAMTYDEPKEDE